MSQYPLPLPLRKRRPFLFCFLLLLGLLAVVMLISAALGYAENKGMFGKRLGLIRIEGFIGDAEKVASWAGKLQRDDSVAGVLLRIDSPGGAVAPSQEMHAAVKRLAAVKPVIVSMGTAAASGGYYIAVAGHEIFASPSTLTGSIGVRMQLANVQGLMQTLGVKSESMATGKFKTTGSPFQPLTDDERKYLDALLGDMQQEFVRTVAEGRKLPLETVAALADGRAFTGHQALALKLVDRLGDREAAYLRLAEICKLPGRPKLLRDPKGGAPWWKELLTSLLDLEQARGVAVPRYSFYY